MFIGCTVSMNAIYIHGEQSLDWGLEQGIGRNARSEGKEGGIGT